jgi:hypothetical protein
MKTCLVSLVGLHTIPNILLAMHLRPDFILLISTPSMEQRGKSRAILETLKLHGLDYSRRHHQVEVDENSIIDLQGKVNSWLAKVSEDFDFIVNLTTGTKLMSIAAYDLFNDYGSTMLYMPLGRNGYIIPFPKRRPSQSYLIHQRLTVAEYLTANSFKIINAMHLQDNRNLALSRWELTYFIFDHYLAVYPLLNFFSTFLRPLERQIIKHGYEFSGIFNRENEEQEYLLNKLGFSCEGRNVSKQIYEPEWNYMRGGWLEERLFLAVLDALPEVTDVQLSIQAQGPSGNDNEFDIVFTVDNNLYLVECKSLSKGNDCAGSTINDFLYKLGSLRQQFGLRAGAFLATMGTEVLDDQGRTKASLVERCLQLNIEIIPLLQVRNPESYFHERFAPEILTADRGRRDD